jgi:phage gp29-like protein
MGIFSSIRQKFGFSHREVPDAGNEPSTGELATRRTRAVSQLMNWLPNPDKVLQDTGKHIEHLRDLLYDDQVFAAVQYLYSALREHRWELRADGQEAQRERAEMWLRRLDWDRLDNEILQGRLFGYQPLEITWRETPERLWMPEAVKAKPAEWFAFDKTNTLKLRSRLGSPDGLRDVPWGKFLLARNKPSFRNPYGQSVLSRCFWPATFKKGDIRFLVTFVEKYGMPWAVARHPRGEDEEAITGLLDMLEDMIQDSVAAVPDDSSVELKEGDKAGSSEVYLNVARYFEQSIDKVLLSSELATSSGEHGTHALGKAQLENVSSAVVTDLTRLKENTMNQLLHRIWHFNGFPEPVPEFRCFLEDEAGKEHAQRDELLVRAGVQFTDAYWKREYNLDDDEFEVGRPQQQERGAPAPTEQLAQHVARFQEQPPETDVDELAEAAAGQNEVNQALMEDLLETPMQLVREGAGAQEVMTALARAYPQLDAAQLEERMRALFFAAEMWGRASAQAEADEAATPSDEQLQ